MPALDWTTAQAHVHSAGHNIGSKQRDYRRSRHFFTHIRAVAMLSWRSFSTSAFAVQRSCTPSSKSRRSHPSAAASTSRHIPSSCCTGGTLTWCLAGLQRPITQSIRLKLCRAAAAPRHRAGLTDTLTPRVHGRSAIVRARCCSVSLTHVHSLLSAVCAQRRRSVSGSPPRRPTSPRRSPPRRPPSRSGSRERPSRRERSTSRDRDRRRSSRDGDRDRERDRDRDYSSSRSRYGAASDAPAAGRYGESSSSSSRYSGHDDRDRRSRYDDRDDRDRYRRRSPPRVFDDRRYLKAIQLRLRG